MKAKGNSRPELCAANLLQITRGEVPYERTKGLGVASIDSPSTRAGNDAAADAVWLLENYEPRIDVDNVNAEAITAETGDFLLSAGITINQRKEGDDNA